MQLELARKLVGMFVDPILDQVFADETGAARLQQIGLFTLIFVEDDGQGVTAQRLADRTRQSLSSIYKQLEKLEAVKVVKKTKTLNRQGRGQAHFFSIRKTEKADRLVKLIVKSATARQRAGRKRQ